MKPPSNAKPVTLPRNLFIFIYACLKAEEFGETANTPPKPEQPVKPLKSEQ